MKKKKRSSIKSLVICWALIMFVSAGQILAQDEMEFAGQENALSEKKEVRTDTTPALQPESRKPLKTLQAVIMRM